jgi:hypothetical protein
MATRDSTGRVRAFSGALDQAFSSASNGLIVFAIAVVSPAGEFGRIAILMTALAAALGCMRGALGTPLLLKSDQSSERIRTEGGYALTAALTVGPALGLALIALGLADVPSALCLALATPAVLAQDVLRYVLIAEGRPHIAAVWDGIWCAGTVALLVLSWLGLDFVSAPVLLGGWSALAYVALLGMLADLRIAPRIAGLRDWISAGMAHRIRYGVDAGLEQITVLAMFSVVAAVLNPAVTGALRGATALLAPVAMFGTAIQVIVISESTRQAASPRQVWSGLLKLAVLTGFVTAVGGFALYTLPPRFGELLLGASWTSAHQILPLIMLEYTVAAFTMALAIFLRTFNRSSDTVRLKIALAATTLVSSTAAAVVFESAIGVAAGLAVANIGVTTVALALVAPWQQRARAGSVDIAAVGTERRDAASSPTSYWPYCRVTLPARDRPLPSFLQHLAEARDDSGSALLGVWTFGVMAVLVPVAIMSACAAPTGRLWLAPMLIIVISAARFAWIMGAGVRRLSETMFWSFTYAFMGLAPLAQLLRDSWPETVPRTDTTQVIIATTIVLGGMLAFLAGVAVDRLVPRRPAPLRGEQRSEATFTVDYGRLMICATGATLLTLFYLSRVGPIQFLKSRDEAFQALNASLFGGSVGVVFRAAVYMSLLVAWVGLVRWRREARVAERTGVVQPPGRMRLNLVLIVVLGLLLANCLNPISNARYLSGTAILAAAAALGMFATARRFRLSAYGFLLGLLVVFPQADAFRYSREATIKGGPMESLLSADYDSFAQVVNSVTVAAREGINYGHQALGVLLFWVPRAIWPGKAVDTGIYIASERGYPFTNLSAPLWIEFYLNAGWIGLIVCMGLLGYFLHRWDTKLNRDLIIFSMPSVLGSIVPFYMLILLRGSLLQAAPYLFFTVVCAIFIGARDKRPPGHATGRTCRVDSARELSHA